MNSQDQSAAGKYLVVMLAHEEWALPLGCVRECVAIAGQRNRSVTATGLATSREHDATLRIVDLRTRFGLPQDAFDDRAHLVVAAFQGACNSTVTVGLLVDALVDVVDLHEGDLADAGTGSDAATMFLRGRAAGDRTMTVITDPGALLSGELDLAHAA